MAVQEDMRKYSYQIRTFEQVLTAHIKAHQSLEQESDAQGNYREATMESRIVSALITVRNECGL